MGGFKLDGIGNVRVDRKEGRRTGQLKSGQVRSGQVSLRSLAGQVRSGQVSTWYEPAARKGVECRLGGSIIKIASRKKQVRSGQVTQVLVRTGCPQGGRVPFGWFYH